MPLHDLGVSARLLAALLDLVAGCPLSSLIAHEPAFLVGYQQPHCPIWLSPVMHNLACYGGRVLVSQYSSNRPPDGLIYQVADDERPVEEHIPLH